MTCKCLVRLHEPQYWGWIVVAADFLCLFLVGGTSRAMGIFYEEWMDYFEDFSTVTSTLSTTTAAVATLFSVVANTIASRCGERPVIITGGILASLGFLTSAFAPNINVLFGTFGIVIGIGWALAMNPLFTLPVYYFKKRPGLVLGIAASGYNIGGMVVAIILQYLVEAYSWRGAAIVMSALSLNLCVCGALARPIEVTPEAPESSDEGSLSVVSSIADPEPPREDIQVEMEIREFNQTNCECIGDELDGPVLASSGAKITFSDKEQNTSTMNSWDKEGPEESESSFYEKKANSHKEKDKPETRLGPEQLNSEPTVSDTDIDKMEIKPEVDQIDPKLRLTDRCGDRNTSLRRSCKNMATNIHSVLLNLQCILYGAGIAIIKSHAKSATIKIGGVSDEEGTFALTAIGGGGFLGSIGIGFLMYRFPKLDALLVFIIAMTICGVCMLGITLVGENYFVILVLFVVVGATLDPHGNILSIAHKQMLGLEDVILAFGVSVMFVGIGGFIGPALAGYVYDMTADYSYSLYIAAAFYISSNILILPSCALNLRKRALFHRKGLEKEGAGQSDVFPDEGRENPSFDDTVKDI